MSAPIRELEAELLLIYHKQVALYRRLLAVSDGIDRDFSGSGTTDDQLQGMNSIMQEISELDAMSLDTRETWRQAGGRPAGELAALLKEVEGLILQVLQRMNNAEKQALSAKERLSPKLSSETRRRRMTAAYQSARSQS